MSLTVATSETALAIPRVVMAEAVAGQMPQTSPREVVVLLVVRPKSVAPGRQKSVPVLLIQLPMESQEEILTEAAVEVLPPPADRATDSGEMESTYLVHRMRVSSVNSLVYPTILQSSRLVSTLPTTMTFLSRHLAMTFPNQLHNLQTLP